MGNYGNKKTDYTYDFKGNITSMIDYKFDGNDSISYHYTYYEYDLNGKMTGYSEINASSDPSDGAINNHKLVYKYDVEGNITEIVYPTSLNDGITSRSVLNITYTIGLLELKQKLIAYIKN